MNKKFYNQLLLLFLVLVNLVSISYGSEGAAEESEDEESEPVDAILFPFFMLALGVISYKLLSSYAPWIPYTGAMFVIGICIGVGVRKLSSHASNLLNESIEQFWLVIDPEVLLVSFLPGLIYHDASGQNTHLFRVAFVQCLNFAFPMVLAGTALTACVAYYIFPYDWSFNLSMTFGAILAATDPVAVAALLDQVGAPPRLKVHIAGESLLNDGSAIVFFTIFSQLFFLELGIDGVGEQIDIPGGFKLFFRMSLGGFCIGVFFGLGLLCILKVLKRRLNREENVTQVGATITMAYLCYFTADVAWGTSGVIAVLTMGIIVTGLGEAYINDPKLMEDFLSIVEWLLNTVLFSLGGLVWGSVISNEDEDKYGHAFEARDWGYLVLLYVLLTVIRFALFIVFFPITKRIGLKSNWNELIFQAFGGLRGSVGIALAIVVDNTVKNYTDNADQQIDPKFVIQSNQLFGMVGGIAFLTLCINGVFAGPLLRYLGLADMTDTRKRMLKCYRQKYRENAISDFVKLLGQRRFKKVSFATIRHHVPFLKDLTRDEVIDAATRYYKVKEATQEEASSDFDSEFASVVDFDGVFMYLEKVFDTDDIDDGSFSTAGRSSSHIFFAAPKNNGAKPDTERPQLRAMSLPQHARAPSGRPARSPSGRPSNHHVSSSRMTMSQVIRGGNSHDMTVNELRRLFLELVRAGYRKQIADGELADREFVVLSLIESLELASESCERQDRLNDWDYVFLVGYPQIALVKYIRNWASRHACIQNAAVKSGLQTQIRNGDSIQAKLDMEKCAAFILAHTCAQEKMRDEFSNDIQLDLIDAKVLQESEREVQKAEAFLQKYDPLEVELVMSHKVCRILLNNAVQFIQTLAESGLMKQQEVEEFFEEIEEALTELDDCYKTLHPGEVLTESEGLLSDHVLRRDEGAAHFGVTDAFSTKQMQQDDAYNTPEGSVQNMSTILEGEEDKVKQDENNEDKENVKQDESSDMKTGSGWSWLLWDLHGSSENKP